MTEQGEVLSAKYSLRDIAHRELELTASAVLGRHARAPARRAARAATTQVVAAMAERSAEVYRSLVYGDEDFPAFFHAATPVDEISQLRLGSRPARRKDSTAIEDFRAIPWVFSWTQARIVLPAWYGLGTRAARRPSSEHGLELLREMREEWPFFAALLANAEMACAKADLAIGRRYAELVPDGEVRERIWSAHRGRVRADARAGCWPCATASACSTPSRCSRPRSTAATRTSTRSRSCRSSCCAARAPARPPTARRCPGQRSCHQRHRQRAAQHRLIRERSARSA